MATFDPTATAPSPQRHHQSINEQLHRHARTHGAAHRTARVQTQHHRHKQPAFCRPGVGGVTVHEPQPIVPLNRLQASGKVLF